MMRAHRRCLFAVLPAIALVAACSSTTAEPTATAKVPLAAAASWPKFRANASQNGAVATKPSGGGAFWSFKTGRGVFSSPVLGADGTTYVGSADRTFYALAPDGTVRWTVATGEIIDSSALLDDEGRVYFGSGDGKLRAIDAASGRVVWTMQADDPSVNKSFLNWFEGNVAIGPSGTLYVPNDNFFVYAIDRESGSVDWRYKMPDQTWSLPAIDADETLYIGNNNLLPLLGHNTFAIGKDGSTSWTAVTLGTVAASPMVTPDGAVVIGGFDGYVRAYDRASGAERWNVATRDHVYASPARLPDGTIVQASTDGTVYTLDPKDGRVRWTFDAVEPIRSSPAVDGDGNVYFGCGDGRLYVLRADGSLRWAMKLIDEERNDLNSSPALGADAVVLGGENGAIFHVPYDYCLRPEQAGDARCTTSKPALADGAALLYTTRFGAVLASPPSDPVDANQPIAASLAVRSGGAAQLAILDTTQLSVKVDPPADVTVDVAGDGKFVKITPKTVFAAGADGTVTIAIDAAYLVGLDRTGLRLSGGHPGGRVSTTFKLAVKGGDATVVDRSATWDVSRLSIPLPTVMPSYNQIGFDSLHYILGLVEFDQTAGQGRGVAWMAGGALPEGQTRAVVDPKTKAIFPLTITASGGMATLSSSGGLRVEVMNIDLPFQSFSIAARIGVDGNAVGSASLSGSTVCGEVPFYGPFLQQLGLCNPQTDIIGIFGAANVDKRSGDAPPAASDVGTVTFASTGNAITATLAGSSIKLADHLAAVLAVDAATGAPVTLGYGLDTKRAADANGLLTSVTVPAGTTTLPAKMRVYLMIDTFAVASGTIG